MLLQGLKVVEFASYIAAPGAGGVCADWSWHTCSASAETRTRAKASRMTTMIANWCASWSVKRPYVTAGPGVWPAPAN